MKRLASKIKGLVVLNYKKNPVFITLATIIIVLLVITICQLLQIKHQIMPLRLYR